MIRRRLKMIPLQFLNVRYFTYCTTILHEWRHQEACYSSDDLVRHNKKVKNQRLARVFVEFIYRGLFFEKGHRICRVRRAEKTGARDAKYTPIKIKQQQPLFIRKP